MLRIECWVVVNPLSACRRGLGRGSLPPALRGRLGGGQMAKKERLDVLVVERGLAETRSQAQALIMAGQVYIGERRADKPGTPIASDSAIEVRGGLKYVSRGGLKLEHALAEFDLLPFVRGKVAADVGASTGGFTDVLLQSGVARVYAIDVGNGQLAWKLRTDPRVAVLDETNIRYLERLPEAVDFASIDTSFIGLKLVLPAVARLLKEDGRIVALVKPQFEVGKGQVGKGGVVRKPEQHRAVLQSLADWLPQYNAANPNYALYLQGLARSPITGPAGNVEFLAYLTQQPVDEWDVAGQIEKLVTPLTVGDARGNE